MPLTTKTSYFTLQKGGLTTYAPTVFKAAAAPHHRPPSTKRSMFGTQLPHQRTSSRRLISSQDGFSFTPSPAPLISTTTQSLTPATLNNGKQSTYYYLSGEINEETFSVRPIPPTSGFVDRQPKTNAALFAATAASAVTTTAVAAIAGSGISPPSTLTCLRIVSDSPLLASSGQPPSSDLATLLPALAETSSELTVSTLPPQICMYYNSLYNTTDALMTKAPQQAAASHHRPSSGDFIESEINEWIGIIIPALCLILGTFGNVMSILVVSRLGGTLKSSSAAYLKYLAIFDLIGIWSSLPRYLTRALFDVDFRDYHPAICKAQRFSVYFSLDIAAWITVAVTADRLIAVRFPYHANKWCTERVSRFVLLATCIAFLLLDGHVFFTYGYKETVRGNKIVIQNCVHPDELSKFIWKYVQPILATLTYAVGPFAFLLLANIIIAQRLIKQSKFLKKCSTSQSAHADKESGRTVYTMSFMLVATSVVFLVMNTPSFFYMVIDGLFLRDNQMTEREKAVHRLLKTCFNMSMYINHSVNFFVYCLSAKKFRTVFWQVLTCQPSESQLGEHMAATIRRRKQQEQKSPSGGGANGAVSIVPPSTSASGVGVITTLNRYAAGGEINTKPPDGTPRVEVKVSSQPSNKMESNYSDDATNETNCAMKMDEFQASLAIDETIRRSSISTSGYYFPTAEQNEARSRCESMTKQQSVTISPPITVTTNGAPSTPDDATSPAVANIFSSRPTDHQEADGEDEPLLSVTVETTVPRPDETDASLDQILLNKSPSIEGATIRVVCSNFVAKGSIVANDCNSRTLSGAVAETCDEDFRDRLRPSNNGSLTSETGEDEDEKRTHSVIKQTTCNQQTIINAYNDNLVEFSEKNDYTKQQSSSDSYCGKKMSRSSYNDKLNSTRRLFVVQNRPPRCPVRNSNNNNKRRHRSKSPAERRKTARRQQKMMLASIIANNNQITKVTLKRPPVDTDETDDDATFQCLSSLSNSCSNSPPPPQMVALLTGGDCCVTTMSTTISDSVIVASPTIPYIEATLSTVTNNNNNNNNGDGNETDLFTSGSSTSGEADLINNDDDDDDLRSTPSSSSRFIVMINGETFL